MTNLLPKLDKCSLFSDVFPTDKIYATSKPSMHFITGSKNKILQNLLVTLNTQLYGEKIYYFHHPSYVLNWYGLM